MMVRNREGVAVAVQMLLDANSQWPAWLVLSGGWWESSGISRAQCLPSLVQAEWQQQFLSCSLMKFAEMYVHVLVSGQRYILQEYYNSKLHDSKYTNSIYIILIGPLHILSTWHPSSPGNCTFFFKGCCKTPTLWKANYISQDSLGEAMCFKWCEHDPCLFPSEQSHIVL